MQQKTWGCDVGDLSVIEIKAEQAPVLYVPGGLDVYLDQIRAAVNEVPDLSTKKGRDRVASLAAQVSRSKTAIEKPGREYLKRLKESVKPAEVEIKRFVDACDTLRDEVRRPLTEYEDTERSRVATLNERLDALRSTATVLDELGKLLPTEAITCRLTFAKETVINESWQEFTAEAGVAKDAAIAKLESALVEAQRRDAEAAELERLRQEQAATEQRQREEQIRRDAEESAKRQAEAEAQARIDEANRVANEQRLALEESERRRVAAEQKAKQDRINAENEKQAAIDAERLRQQQAEQARQEEARRIADEEAARAADFEHRRTINRNVIADLIAAGLPDELAKQAVRAIASGNIRNTVIKY
ncbi:hypothetical protein DZA65_03216 [Dickeya dianthicola]|uniref:hypothetical protein n=1 Tax=Dickeya dianthicola TaxID=204039 RepID=UPI000CD3C16F|nr:hypothetical protein [Dickeya dianthicola]AYC20091.1 hypothetical protein DZA65_03216 [Dickeya dianthicola]MBI0438407.1 hypothetical protein [Dickeya dianthicola]MBI0450916.1 hypothetical protein [Dickeya dianthicola]MBI0454320.1 hypothetical protein [Dickeya dianthicola]MBI0458537.1 hypothetical protein [Dickeya dianthicola]